MNFDLRLVLLLLENEESDPVIHFKKLLGKIRKFEKNMLDNSFNDKI